MNANEAKKQALENKTKMAETASANNKNKFDTDVKSLLDHFKGQISAAISKGHLATPKITIGKDQFNPDVVNEVVGKLRLEGYSVEQEEHNAYGKKMFTVSWA